MSGFGVAGPLSSKLTQLTCGYQGQAANERRKISAGASQARSRTRSSSSLALKDLPAFLFPCFPVVRFAEINAEFLCDLLKRQLWIVGGVVTEVCEHLDLLEIQVWGASDLVESLFADSTTLALESRLCRNSGSAPVHSRQRAGSIRFIRPE